MPPLVFAIAEDRAGFLWLGMRVRRALYRLDPVTGKTVEFDLADTAPEGPGSGVLRIYSDPAGIFWLNTDTGLVRFGPLTGKYALYPQGVPGGKADLFVRSTAQDCEGKLWLSTAKEARDIFAPKGGCFAWRRAVPDPQKMGTDINLTMMPGAGAGVWMGSPRGVEVFEPANGTVALLRHNPSDRYSLSAGEVLSIAVDQAGSVWVGTKGGGVNRISPATMLFGSWRPDPGDPASLSDEHVRAISRDRHGGVWIGTYNRGLERLDPVTGRFTHFTNDPRNPKSLSSNQVYSIYEDRSGNLWASTFFGANRLDGNGRTFTRFPKVVWNSQIYSLLEDRQGRFWYGSALTTNLLDRQTGKLTNVPIAGELSIYEDRGGTLWFGSTAVLARLDPSDDVPRVVLPRNSAARKSTPLQINFIHEDPAGLLWLATETGLTRFDPKSEQSTNYTVRHGLPDNVVQCILPDQNGNLWRSTNNGLSRFNPCENSFANYRESDGLQGDQFSRKACFVDTEGVMYFGGLHGFNRFHPRRVSSGLRTPSPVLLTELRVNGYTVPVRRGSLLPRPIWQMDTLYLTSKDTEFSFEFAALTYSDSARMRYRFRLDGMEDQWTLADSAHRSARYTRVAPGQYRFRVQASVDGRDWGSEEASLAISVAPPWWMTPWSRFAGLLILSSVLLGAYWLRVRSLYRRERLLRVLVEQRTAELEEARNQAEQANRAKSVFLASMSHELRTPLNAILGFSNLLRNSNISDGQRRDLDIINRSGEHLLTLINDVLDVAKIEAGGTTLTMVSCDLRRLVQDVVDMVRVRAGEKKLKLLVEEEADFPRVIEGDPAKLRQILINLLANAVKFTEEGSVTLRLGAKSDGPAEHVTVRFEVEDTGVGIAPEDQRRFFQAFEQAGDSPRQVGTGLGLAIARQFIELMRGTIELESTPGKGSCFRVEIPLRKACEADGNLPERASVVVEPGNPSAGS